MGSLVGLAFDGNWESIISDWDFLPQVTRSIHVDVRYILWVMDAVDGADAVYTDVWASMGQEQESQKRLQDFQGFRVTQEMMAVAKPEAVFMHCLPAHREEEISSEVLDGPQSLVLDQAENRLHLQKALLAKLLRRK